MLKNMVANTSLFDKNCQMAHEFVAKTECVRFDGEIFRQLLAYSYIVVVCKMK
jgi:hypothetical protein